MEMDFGIMMLSEITAPPFAAVFMAVMLWKERLEKR